MRRVGVAVLAAMILSAVGSSLAGPAVELTAAGVANPKGDGPDGKGNTADDTWQFWFQLIHMDQYRRLDLATAAMSAGERANGRRGKITGPIGGYMPNKDATEGWIYHSDWDGRFEGVWGDTQDGKIYAHPYNEKTDGGAVAVTYKVPRDGVYKVTATVTDVNVAGGHPQMTGITCILDLVNAGDGVSLAPAVKELKRAACGDDAGPATVTLTAGSVQAGKGQMLRLVIDPNKWWGGDMTLIETFKIERTR